MLPFTREQFLALFVRYNEAIWPVQVAAAALGFAMIVLVLVPARGRNRLIGVGLAAMWAWTGIVYHWHTFLAINPAARVFAALFVLQAALFFVSGAIRGHEHYRAGRGPRAWVGWALIGYAFVLYPLIGLWSARAVDEIPMFGVTPCPVTIFTLGLLLLARPMARWLLAIPLLWSLVGGSAAFLLGLPQDWGLLLAGIATLWVELGARREAEGAAPPR